MIFGKTTFKCDECGKRFMAPAAEWCATGYIAPAKCPKCGSMHTYPAGIRNLCGLFGPGFYKKIWESQDINVKSMIQSGFPSLDKLTHGFEKGKLYVIADKTPLLNSVIGANFAYNMTIKNHHAMLYFPMSCDNTQKMFQLLSIKRGISTYQIKEELLEPSQRKRLEDDTRFIHDSGLYFDDTLSSCPEEVCNKIKATFDDNKFEIVIIDGFSVDNTNIRTEIIQSLKTLVIELQIPIVVITKYTQQTFRFTEQSLQWKKLALNSIDCLMFVQPPLRRLLAFKMNIPMDILHSPVCNIPRNIYEVHVVKNIGNECGSVRFWIDYSTNKLTDIYSSNKS